MTTQFVSSGVVSSGVVVTSGNILEVLSGGTADVTSVTSGGVQQVDAGGFASGTVISAGGSDTVLGSETGAIIDSGGVLTLSGGSVNSTTINSGGSLVLSGGSFSHIVDNGTLDFAGGGQGHMTGVSGTGVVEVTNGGTLALSLVSSSSNFTGSFIIGDDSELLLTSAGAALGRPIDFAGANTELRIDDTVMPSDVISGFVPGGRWIFLDKTSFTSSGSAQVLPGNVLQVVEGAVTDDLQLDPSQNYTGQTLVLLPHGIGGTLVGIGQVTTVSSGSGISGTTISSGIIEEIFGSASNVTVASGGTAVVFSGDTASGTTLLSGAAEFLYGSDVSTTVSNGGELRVEAGGTASASIIDSGGRELVISGGAVSGGTVNDGGRMTVDAGGTTTSVSLVGSDSSADGGREILSGRRVSRPFRRRPN